MSPVADQLRLGGAASVVLGLVCCLAVTPAAAKVLRQSPYETFQSAQLAEPAAQRSQATQAAPNAPVSPPSRPLAKPARESAAAANPETAEAPSERAAAAAERARRALLDEDGGEHIGTDPEQVEPDLVPAPAGQTPPLRQKSAGTPAKPDVKCVAGC